MNDKDKKLENELQPEIVLSMLAKRGLIAENAADSEKVKEAKQKKQRRAYHNTQLLLKHYRTMAWMLECMPDTIVSLISESPPRKYVKGIIIKENDEGGVESINYKYVDRPENSLSITIFGVK